ncbi:MAG: hypothetical protein IPP80_14565 [Ignavibacteria bacterium]|nr:hypothetical protein [Ignavibacteria bacterium]
MGYAPACPPPPTTATITGAPWTMIGHVMSTDHRGRGSGPETDLGMLFHAVEEAR